MNLLEEKEVWHRGPSGYTTACFTRLSINLFVAAFSFVLLLVQASKVKHCKTAHQKMQATKEQGCDENENSFDLARHTNISFCTSLVTLSKKKTAFTTLDFITCLSHKSVTKHHSFQPRQ